MVETQDELKTEIGNEEAVVLKPATVKVLNITIEEVGEKKAKKAVFEVKHPDSVEPIHISGMKYEMKGQLKVVGTWINKDSKGLIRKGSALAILIQTYTCKTVEELKGKEIPTILDEKGYLVFKVY